MLDSDSRPSSSLERIASWSSNGRAALSVDVLQALTPALHVNPKKSGKVKPPGNRFGSVHAQLLPFSPPDIIALAHRPHSTSELHDDPIPSVRRSQSSMGMNRPAVMRNLAQLNRHKGKYSSIIVPATGGLVDKVFPSPEEIENLEDLHTFKDKIDEFERTILDMEQKFGMRYAERQDSVPNDFSSETGKRKPSASDLAVQRSKLRQSNEVDSYLNQYVFESKLPRVAVELQKWWRMTISRVKYKRFRRAIALFQNRFAMLCLKHWRWVCVAEDIRRHRVIGKPLWAWRLLSRNTLIWDEETAVIFLECARVRGLPQRPLFTEVSDKEIFVRAGKEHNYGQGYMFGRPLKTREHVMVVQLIRRVLMKSAKTRLMRWRKRAMWSLRQIGKGRSMLEGTVQALKDEKHRLSFIMWRRIAKVYSCVAKLQPVPSFEPHLHVWTAWLRSHENKKRLQSDQVAAIRERFYCRTMWLRWIGARELKHHKQSVKKQVFDHYRKRLCGKCVAAWHEGEQILRAAKHRTAFMLRRISAAVHVRKLRRDVGQAIRQKRGMRLIKPAFDLLKSIATSMLAIRAGSAKRLADNSVRALWALYAWLQISSSPDGSDGADTRKPGGLMMLGICDAHFPFLDCWRRWAAKSRRRIQFREFVQVRFQEHILVPALQPVVFAWRSVCGARSSKDGTAVEPRKMPHRHHQAKFVRRPIKACLDPALTLRFAALHLLVRKKASAEKGEEVEAVSQSDRIAWKAQEYIKILADVTPTGGAALRGFIAKEAERSFQSRSARAEILSRDYKILLSKELLDAFRDFGQVYNTEYNRKGEHPSFKLDTGGTPVDDDPFSPSQDWFPEFPQATVLPSPNKQTIPAKVVKRFMIDDPASPLMIWHQRHPDVAPFMKSLLITSKVAAESGRVKESKGYENKSASLRKNHSAPTTKDFEPPNSPQEEKLSPFKEAPGVAESSDMSEPSSVNMWDYESNQRRIELGIERILRETQGKLLAGEESTLPTASKTLMDDVPEDPYFKHPKEERIAKLSDEYCQLRDKELGPESTLLLLEDAESSSISLELNPPHVKLNDAIEKSALTSEPDFSSSSSEKPLTKTLSKLSPQDSWPGESNTNDLSSPFHGMDLAMDLSVPRKSIENVTSEITPPSPTQESPTSRCSPAPTYLHRRKSLLFNASDNYLVGSISLKQATPVESMNDNQSEHKNDKSGAEIKMQSDSATVSAEISSAGVKPTDEPLFGGNFSRTVSVWSDEGSIGEHVHGERPTVTNVESLIVTGNDTVDAASSPLVRAEPQAATVRVPVLKGIGDEPEDTGEYEGAPKAKPIDEKEVIWKGLMEENQWVLSEAKEIKEAMKGGLDSLYWRSKVISKRSKRQLEVQAAIEKDFQISRQMHIARQAKVSGAIWASDIIDVISNLKPVQKSSARENPKMNKAQPSQIKIKNGTSIAKKENEQSTSEYCDFGRISLANNPKARINQRHSSVEVIDRPQSFSSKYSLDKSLKKSSVDTNKYYPLTVEVKLNDKRKGEISKDEKDVQITHQSNIETFFGQPTISQQPSRPASVLEGLQIRANSSRPSSVTGINLSVPAPRAHTQRPNSKSRQPLIQFSVSRDGADSGLKSVLRPSLESLPGQIQHGRPPSSLLPSTMQLHNVPKPSGDDLSVITKKGGAQNERPIARKEPPQLVVGLAHLRAGTGPTKSKKSTLLVCEPIVRSLSLPSESKNSVKSTELGMDCAVNKIKVNISNKKSDLGKYDGDDRQKRNKSIPVEVDLHHGTTPEPTEGSASVIELECSSFQTKLGVSVSLTSDKGDNVLQHTEKKDDTCDVRPNVVEGDIKLANDPLIAASQDENHKILWIPWTEKSAFAILQELKASDTEDISSSSAANILYLPSEDEINMLEEKYLRTISEDEKSVPDKQTSETTTHEVQNVLDVNELLSNLEGLVKVQPQNFQNSTAKAEAAEPLVFGTDSQNAFRSDNESASKPDLIQHFSDQGAEKSRKNDRDSNDWNSGHAEECQFPTDDPNSRERKKSSRANSGSKKAKLGVTSRRESQESAFQPVSLAPSTPALLLTAHQIKVPAVPRSRKSISRFQESLSTEHMSSFTPVIFDPGLVRSEEKQGVLLTRKATFVEKQPRRVSAINSAYKSDNQGQRLIKDMIIPVLAGPVQQSKDSNALGCIDLQAGKQQLDDDSHDFVPGDGSIYSRQKSASSFNRYSFSEILPNHFEQLDKSEELQNVVNDGHTDKRSKGRSAHRSGSLDSSAAPHNSSQDMQKGNTNHVKHKHNLVASTQIPSGQEKIEAGNSSTASDAGNFYTVENISKGQKRNSVIKEDPIKVISISDPVASESGNDDSIFAPRVDSSVVHSDASNRGNSPENAEIQEKSQVQTRNSEKLNKEEKTTVQRRSRRNSDFSVQKYQALKKATVLNRASTSTSLLESEASATPSPEDHCFPAPSAVHREISLEDLLRSNVKLRNDTDLFDLFKQENIEAGDTDFVQYVNRAVNVTGESVHHTKPGIHTVSLHRSEDRPETANEPPQQGRPGLQQVKLPQSPLGALRPQSPHVLVSKPVNEKSEYAEEISDGGEADENVNDIIQEPLAFVGDQESAKQLKSKSGLIPLDLFAKMHKPRRTRSKAVPVPWNDPSIQLPVLAPTVLHPSRDSDDEMSDFDDASAEKDVETSAQVSTGIMANSGLVMSPSLTSTDSVTHWSTSASLALAREVDRRFETLRLKKLTSGLRKTSHSSAFAESSSSSESSSPSDVANEQDTSKWEKDMAQIESVPSTPGTEGLRAALLMGHQNVTPSGTYDARLRGIRSRLLQGFPSTDGISSVGGESKVNQPMLSDTLLGLPSTYAPRPGEILHHVEKEEIDAHNQTAANGLNAAVPVLARRNTSNRTLRRDASFRPTSR